MNKEIKIFELFAGIGSPRKALDKIGINYKSLGYSEIDKHAIKSYCAIHNDKEENNYGDITKIDKLPDLIDLLIAGTPCTSFSLAGLGLGGDEGSGTASSLMWEHMRLVKAARPKVVIWENVTAVKNKDHKHNFDKYISTMEKIGYKSTHRIIKGTDVGIPQTRPRIIVVSILEGEEYEFNLPKVDVQSITKFVDFTDKEEIIIEASSDVKKLYSDYEDKKIKNGTIIFEDGKIIEKLIPISEEQQRREWDWKSYEKPYKKVMNEDSICPTLTTRCGANTSSKKLISLTGKKDLEGTYEPTIRQITPLEMFRLMGFSDEDYLKANTVSLQSQLAKQAGNSMIVDVMESVIKNLKIIKE